MHNMTAILIANFLGVVILITLGTTRVLRLLEQRERNVLCAIVVFNLIACIGEPIGFFVDGKPGTLYYIINFGWNTMLFASNMIIGFLWLLFVVWHFHRMPGFIVRIYFSLLCGAGIGGLIANFFTPIVFGIEEGNIYCRGELFFFYILIYASFVIYGVYLIYLAQKKRSALRLYPIAFLFAPLTLGATLQSTFYGVSTIWPFSTLFLTAVFLGLQNEIVFTDQLTRLFTRPYLDELKRKAMSVTGDHLYTVMMLDLNDFKSINDRLGHSMGDDALFTISRIIESAVGNAGVCIRYGGDEFLILMERNASFDINRYIEKINFLCEECNKNGDKPYQLSVSVGHCDIDLRENSMNEILCIADRVMYENKANYHKLRSEES